MEAENEGCPDHARLAERALIGWAFACVAVDGERWEEGELYRSGRRCVGSDPPTRLAKRALPTAVDTREPFTETWRWQVPDPEREAFLEHAETLLASVEKRCGLRGAKAWRFRPQGGRISG